MCGRFTLIQPEAIAQTFGVEKVADLAAQYNIAPTQMVATVLQNSKTFSREFQQLRWGLIPSWAKNSSMGAKLINARAETVAEKPSFRSAFKRRRCLIVANGFYEWQHQEKKKQPFYIHLQDGQPFGFASLWEQWKSPSGEEIDSCTIVTTEANEFMRSLHDRMPVILNPQDYDLWLNPEVQDPEALQKLLRPYASSEMTAYPVSTLVNNPRHNSSECIKPISEERHN
jgi:putative SOS response-associated peptidase YedK